MLKSGYFWMVTTVLFLCTAVSFFVKYSNIVDDYNTLVRSHSGLRENHRTLERYLVAKDSLEIASNHLQIDYGEDFLHIGTRASKSLKDIVRKDELTVVLRLVEGICMSCYGSLLEDFEQWGKDKNTAYITSYKNVRALGRLADRENRDAAVFNSLDLEMPLDALKTPFLFAIDGKGRATNFFAISKSHPHLLKVYLRSVKSSP